MPISAKILADSISPAGIRLTTWEISCHRWILAEINTHRVLSRNFRSSRAVPVARMLEEVRNDPAMPVEWRKNQKGMVGGLTFDDPEELNDLKEVWLKAAVDAAYNSEKLLKIGLHKQWANRLLEPFLWVHGIISATEVTNFFELRRNVDAQPEFKALADLMWIAREKSTPRKLAPGEWHLPYIEEGELNTHGVTKCLRISAARCARVSIRPFDGNADLTAEFDRADRLLKDKHLSPFEHQATPDRQNGLSCLWVKPNEHGNYYGWRQYRKMLPSDCATI